MIEGALDSVAAVDAEVNRSADIADTVATSDATVAAGAAAADAATERLDARVARHRAERVRNRRPSSGAPRRVVALSCATAILGVSAFGAVAAASADDKASLTAASDLAAAPQAAASAGDEITSSIEIAERPAVTSALSTAAAPFTGGTQVTVTGDALDQVGHVVVGGVEAPIVAAVPEQLTFQVPAVAESALGGVPVAFTDVAGEPVAVTAPGTATVAGASAPVSLATQLTEIDEAAVHAATQSLVLTYTSNPAIDAQVGYVLTYWSGYNTAEYTVLSGVDCANFASQSLVARGWAMDAGWYYDRATGAMSPSWASSTAMRDWLYGRPDLATPLDDSQRGLVKVGDIAQFDWDGSGDRDHTAIVTRVEHTASGTNVWVGGHTKDADYWNVDEALASGGGAVTYFSLE
ncbi:amidase domain-containing protein [Agromyces subbeticus]|uniref:amidase domain-containing protein n=1 Tax=Agromyces subbeticus TaxID=293890 RepID=UPI0003B52B9A|nr:amidase domain-containing protein [Agromyces subbeticus]